MSAVMSWELSLSCVMSLMSHCVVMLICHVRYDVISVMSFCSGSTAGRRRCSPLSYTVKQRRKVKRQFVNSH